MGPSAVLSIRVVVANSQATAALNQTQAQLAALAAAGAAPGAGAATGWSRFFGGVQAGATKAGNAVRWFDAKLHASSVTMTKWGKNLQWTGRQLEFAFTIPLALAAGFATKWALENEAAMARVKKVYGDGSESAAQLKAETDALAKSFELLSSRYGVQQKQVLEIAEAWAQAGSAGVGLARATENTLQFMIVSGMDAQRATESLIATQAIYGLSTQDMAVQMAHLNAIENQTAIDMEGLVDVLQRAGGAARVAGIDIRHLGALAAALVPATGSASTAGDSLKTVLARLFAPTAEAQEALAALGIEMNSATWQMATGEERIMMVAKSMENLTQAQQVLVTEILGGQRQFSRLSVLMEDVRKENGYYAKALEATSSAQKSNATYAKELSIFLSSQPQAFKILTTTLQNYMAKAILPLLPAMIGLLQRIVMLAQAFANLDPETQQFIMGLLLALALLGPLVRYIGALSTLFGTLGQFISFAGKSLLKFWAWMKLTLAATWAWAFGTSAAGGAVASAWLTISTYIGATWLYTIGAMSSAWAGFQTLVIVGSRAIYAAVMSKLIMPIVTAIGSAVGAIAAAVGVPVWVVVAVIAAAVATIVAIFNEGLRNKVIDALRAVVDGLKQLPSIIATVFKNIVTVVASAMKQVIEWISYLNPWQRHSPSLVEQVTSGVDAILSQYRRLGAIKSLLSGARSAHNAFLDATDPARGAMAAAENARTRDTIVSFAPGAGPSFDAMVAYMAELEATLPSLEAAIREQEAVVELWADALDNANYELDQAETLLGTLRDTAQDVTDQISEAKAAIDALANAGIIGMGDMADEIFANEMAQKRLRLEILKLEEAGQSVDDLKDRMSALNGEIETLIGEREDLRLAGAGSEVLDTYDAQIAALEDQREALEGMESPINALQAELEKLQRQGEMLELEKSIRFDEQIRQITELAKGVEELPFDEIITKIKEQQANIALLEQAQVQANAQVTAQQAVVDQIKAKRDEINATYDIEKAKLDELKDLHTAINEEINNMENSITSLVGAIEREVSQLKKLKEEAQSPFAEDFAAAGLGDWEIPGGEAAFGREGDLADIEAFNAELQAELDRVLNDMGDLDPFKPIKDAWGTVTEWFGERWQSLKDIAGNAWDWIVDKAKWVADKAVGAFQWLMGMLGSIFGFIGGILLGIWNGVIYPVFEAIRGFIADKIMPVLGAVGAWFLDIWQTKVAPALLWVWDTVLKPVFEWLVDFFQKWILPVLQMFAALWEITFRLIAAVIMWVHENAVKPVVEWLVENFGNIIPAIIGFLGAAFMWLWDNVIFPVLNNIGDIITRVWEQIIRPIFNGIVWVVQNVLGPVFKWLWDNVFYPVFDNIGHYLSEVWNTIIKPIFDGMKWVLENVVGPAFTWLKDKVIKPIWDAITDIIGNAWNKIGGILEAGINGFVSVFNTVADGINWVSDKVGGSIRIDHMQKVDIVQAYARGGTIGGGFTTNGPMAVVGEGNPLHPEYVIPTDPAYRRRALGLFASLGRNLGIPGLAEGGQIDGSILGSESGFDPGQFMKEAAEYALAVAASAIWEPVKAIATNMANGIPLEFLRAASHKTIGMVDSWVTGDAIKLAAGGQLRVPRTPGGVNLTVGEGRNGERVQVLPYDDDGDGGTVNNFYGDLSFPNVRSGDDAEAFLRNIETLSGA